MGATPADPKDALLYVDTEFRPLERVLIHSPDPGIGKVIPKKAQDWLYEDIVHLSQMRAEYDVFKQLLLAFLDPVALSLWFERECPERSHAIPGRPEFVQSKRVLEAQALLIEVLKDPRMKTRLVSSVCAIEGIDWRTQESLLEDYTEKKLAKVLITGMIGDGSMRDHFVFPPEPNFIFTRDIGVTIQDRFLLSKAAKTARFRESLLAKYLAFSILGFDRNKIVELRDDAEYFLCDEKERLPRATTIEGGDVMVVSPNHLLVGVSERTTPNAVRKLVNALLAGGQNCVNTVSLITLPSQRGTMHLDTVFTQVRRNLWVVYPPLVPANTRAGVAPNDVVRIETYRKPLTDLQPTVERGSLRDFLTGLCIREFQCAEGEVGFVECGGGKYPAYEREQWTDACNLLALREGVVVGYDRNEATTRAFEGMGFKTPSAIDLLKKLRQDWQLSRSGETIQKALDREVQVPSLILIPSAELSRARGGAHCLTLPLLRKRWSNAGTPVE